AAALAEFGRAADNPGRMNLFRVGAGYVVVDYGHNPAALAAVGALAARWRGRRCAAVFTVPGDRNDWVVAEAGRVAARVFDRLIIREDNDTRGRRRGELAELLCRAVRQV